ESSVFDTNLNIIPTCVCKVAATYPRILPRLPARKQSTGKHNRKQVHLISIWFMLLRAHRYNTKRPVTVDTAIRIDQVFPPAEVHQQNVSYLAHVCASS